MLSCFAPACYLATRSAARWSFLTAALLVSTCVVAQENQPTPPRKSDSQPERFSSDRLYEPTPVPDRIILSWESDPATSQSMTWRTDDSVGQAFVEYAVAEDGPKFVRKLTRVTAKSSALNAGNRNSLYHSATLTELNPETLYAYRVGDGTNWSEFSHFRTASDQPKPFTFIYFGDSQNDLKSHWSRVVREAYRSAPDAAFMLHAGDLVNVAKNDHEWGEWFYGGGWINRTMPSLATPGNHEYKKGELTEHWRHLFTLPQNGPANLSETVYWLDYQGVRLISLNSNESVADQLPWFEETMRSSKAKWHIVTMHHPIYSTAKKRDNAELRAQLQPLFDKYKIDIVLQGHDHTYGRTGLVHQHDDQGQHAHRNPMPSQPRRRTIDLDTGADALRQVASNVSTGIRLQDKPGGTVYVVSVSGPKMYDLNRRPIFQKMLDNTQLYQTIEIDGSTLRFSAFTATGKLYDRFDLKKGEQGNQLVEIEQDQ